MNIYTGYAVDFVSIGSNQFLLLGSPRYKKFNGRVTKISNFNLLPFFFYNFSSSQLQVVT